MSIKRFYCSRSTPPCAEGRYKVLGNSDECAKASYASCVEGRNKDIQRLHDSSSKCNWEQLDQFREKVSTFVQGQTCISEASQVPPINAPMQENYNPTEPTLQQKRRKCAWAPICSKDAQDCGGWRTENCKYSNQFRHITAEILYSLPPL